MSVIVADYPENPVLERRLVDFTTSGLLLPRAAYRLPFWAHNNHMVIAMRMDFDRGSTLPVRWTPVKAIAYLKFALSPKVNPILVEERYDLERLVTMYFGYVYKAKQFFPENQEGERERLGVPDVDLSHVTSERDTLLDSWWQLMMDDFLAQEGG
jgi:hypothetical protein